MQNQKENSVRIVMYHYVRDLNNSRYPEIKGMDVSKFKKQIEMLSQEYTMVRVEDIMEAFHGGKPLPPNAMHLTFDDGYIDHYDHVFPILDEQGIQGSFYIPGKVFTEHKLLDVNKIHFILASAPIGQLFTEVKAQMDHYRGNEFSYPSNEELFAQYGKANRFDPAEVIFVKRMLQSALPEKLRHIISSNLFEKYIGMREERFARELYVSGEQIACMKRHGMYFGIHGYDHYWLGRLPKEQMEKDLSMALDAMEPYLDRDGWVMNYPYGSEGAYSEDVLSFIEKKGCKIGFTTEAADAVVGECDRLLIPRYDTNDFPV